MFLFTNHRLPEGRRGMDSSVWRKCLDHLEDELSAQQFNTWIRPLQAVEGDAEIRLLAPNVYVRDQVSTRFMARISELVGSFAAQNGRTRVELLVGSSDAAEAPPVEARRAVAAPPPPSPGGPRSELNSAFTFATFVEGKSNELAKAAAIQVAENAGRS
jgi:chromosomal replication initiator protein